jgi:superfamily II DNA/RNA helicase
LEQSLSSVLIPEPTATAGPTFSDLGAPVWLGKNLARRGVTDPFPIQAATIPDALAGRDVSGRAPTGSGKTIAFGIPLVLRTGKAEPRRPRSLVLAPTRELAAQICDELRLLGHQHLRIEAFYGGVGFDRQLKALRRGVDVAVACPGRLADLIERGDVRLDDVELVVIDEADRMADMGFLPEVKRLLDACRADRQTLLFSATLDGDVDVLVRRYQSDPVRHEHVRDEDEADHAEHLFWSVDRADRVKTVAAIIERVGPTVVFCRTKHGCDRVAGQLERAGARAVAIHGGRNQSQRERALDQFRRGSARAIVATDVAARGIHVDGVACVIHFDPPAEAKDYVHRSGRTGRAGAGGVVISLVPNDMRKHVANLGRDLDRPVEFVRAAITSLPEGAPVVEMPADPTPRRDRDDRPKRNGRRPGARSNGASRSNTSSRNGASRGNTSSRNGASRGNSGSNRNGSSARNGSARSNGSSARNGNGNAGGNGSSRKARGGQTASAGRRGPASGPRRARRSPSSTR